MISSTRHFIWKLSSRWVIETFAKESWKSWFLYAWYSVISYLIIKDLYMFLLKYAFYYEKISSCFLLTFFCLWLFWICQAKLAKLRRDLLTPTTKGGGGAGEGFDVTKSGDARVGLVGFPSVGKSTLLNKLTGTFSEVFHLFLWSTDHKLVEMLDLFPIDLSLTCTLSLSCMHWCTPRICLTSFTRTF